MFLKSYGSWQFALDVSAVLVTLPVQPEHHSFEWRSLSSTQQSSQLLHSFPGTPLSCCRCCCCCFDEANCTTGWQRLRPCDSSPDHLLAGIPRSEGPGHKLRPGVVPVGSQGTAARLAIIIGSGLRLVFNLESRQLYTLQRICFTRRIQSCQCRRIHLPG